ncbi:MULTISPECIES: hypothetical protein [Micromonospora]|uniref:Uncharacterized protein n=1 Tax=Micromonospora antibiotica TaxID=2807623 RepID=A0ABS3V715_9ACTN|nr:hypothetical protein [Micromonospora antibiotica]MBO4161404.1 hypothetical protein [Micromonospora antibiotica]
MRSRTPKSASRRRADIPERSTQRVDRHSWTIRINVALFVLSLFISLAGLAADFFDWEKPARPAPTPTAGTQAERSPSEQFHYQATMQDGRLDLFEGELYVTTDRTVDVTEWFTVRVLICGPANSDDLCLYPTELASPGATPQRPSKSMTVPIGGRVGVILTAPYSDVEIMDDLNPEGSAQPLTDPTDAGTWWWDVRASKPGTYQLRGAVFVLAADTDRELVTRETFTITLTVERTKEYAAKKLWTMTLNVTEWSVPQIITVLAALIGAGAFAALIRRRLG